jgi:hypothetical protein
VLFKERIEDATFLTHLNEELELSLNAIHTTTNVLDRRQLGKVD